MSALPITPPTPRPARRRPRPRLRLVVATGGTTVDDVAAHQAEEAPQDALAPGQPHAGSADDSLAPRSRSQALRRRAGALLLGGALVAGLVAGGLQLATSSVHPAAAGLPLVPASAATVVVQSGQTVWSIAATHAPAGVSTADYAAMIVEHNDLADGAVDQWQVLRLPTP